MHAHSFPPFTPHPLLPGGHMQTVAAQYAKGRGPRTAGLRHIVDVDEGDRIVLHDNCPSEWQPGSPTVLLVHGLGGCHGSPYMRRIAAKLVERGIRSWRMDLRACGAGLALARLPYHSGRTADVVAAIDHIRAATDGSPMALVGFSLGGNIVLKLIGESGEPRPHGLVGAIAVSPPVDLAESVAAMERPAKRFYNRFFVRMLLKQVRDHRKAVPHGLNHVFPRRPKGLREFDELFTAPVCGFNSAADYYERASSAPLVSRIRVPTMVLASRDDPLVPVRPLDRAAWPENVEVRITNRGGHIGFIGRRGVDADPYWMDWRVVEWIAARTAKTTAAPSGAPGA